LGDQPSLLRGHLVQPTRALPLAIAMRYGVVASQEAYLEGRFGDAYRDYKARVRRWL